MNEPILPEHDKDLRLAYAWGLSLESGRPLALQGDPMIEALADLKKTYRPFQDAYLPEAETSQRLWHAIARATTPRVRLAQTQARILTLHSAIFRVAAAAVIFVVVAIAWLTLRPSGQPQLLAEAGSQIVTHVLADGSTITMRPHSKLFSLSENDASALYRLEGEAFFDVTRNEGRTFAVDAGNAVVSVLGTEFNVNTWGEEVTVFLQEGRVELKNKTSNQVVVLSPGQSGSVSLDQVSVQGQPADAEVFLDWMNLEIAFTSSPIEDVVKELEFHYDIHIEVPSERASEKITGPIALESLEYVLDRLSMVMGGGRFVNVGKDQYRFESD